jgi:diguanylate cyclase (GGDEF)-like protein
MARKLGVVALLVASFVVFNFVVATITPLHPLPTGILGLIRVVNIAAAFGLLAYFSQNFATAATRAEVRLELLAGTDPLTNLYNRRRLIETATLELTRHRRSVHVLSLIICDIDDFKQVNDRYGHAVGDAVLREIGGLLLSRLRRMDIACRYGGEELIVLLPDCGATDALSRATEICAAVRGLRDRAESTLPPVTVSIGVASWPDHGEQIAKVIEAADAALYAAKRSGRDRALPATEAAPALPLAAE